MRPTLVERYRSFLPVTDATPLLSLGEGNTPLLRAHHLERRIGCGELYLKLEGCNPTGSFKDRGMVVAVTKAMESGSSAIVCASTGNTSASAAAYAAKAGIKAFVVVPKGGIAAGKLAQALLYGADVIAIEGTFDEALALARRLPEAHAVTLVNSINPYRIEGQKTGAFEIVDELGFAPDYLSIPVGNAGNITAYWKGFQEYFRAGKASGTPRMLGFEAEGAAAIVRNEAISRPQTIASAIRIGNPANWKAAVQARDQSGGLIDWASDKDIVEAYKLLAAKEGVFGEPASAAAVAGLLKLARNGEDFSGKRIVCIVTGNGLKDPDVALGQVQEFCVIPPEMKALEDALDWG